VNRDLWEGCLKAEVLVTGALGIHWVSSIAEKMGKRWAVIQLSFPTNSTREFPFAGFDFPGFDFFKFPAYNWATFWLLRSFFWRRVRTAVNDHRKSLGLPTLRQSIFEKAESDHILTCYAVSPALLKRPGDWGAHIKVTGFLTLPSQTQKTAVSSDMSEIVREWLRSGDRPIYIGLGSMPIPDPALFTRILRELLARTSYRFIFCQGWSALPDLPLDSRLLVTPSVDHQWLFPQCQAAIIHGGIGTLAAALRAAVPTVVLSIFGDQHWWGKLIQKRKLGCHVPFKRLTTEKLMAAIQNALAPEIAQNLAGLAEELNREDGLENTIDRIEEYFGGGDGGSGVAGWQ
jgi:sterol 3beta-glucosyltransferase